MEDSIVNCLIVLLTACSSMASDYGNHDITPSIEPPLEFLTPPFVYEDAVNGNDLPDYTNLLQLQGEVEAEGFTIDSVSHMTASVVPNGLENSCTNGGIHRVDGSIDCVFEYFSFRRFQPTLRYDDFIDPVAQKENCYDYTVGFKQCYLDPSADVNLLACNDPNKMVDGDKSTIWAREINPYKDTIINLDLNGRYRVVALTIMLETIPLKVSVTLKRRDATPLTVVTIQQGPCDPNDKTCRPYESIFRNQLTLSWVVDPEWQVADEVQIRFWSQNSYDYNGVYSTNYHIIRDIKLLAKPVEGRPASTPPRVTRPAPENRQRQYKKPDVPAPRTPSARTPPSPPRTSSTTTHYRQTTMMPKENLIKLLRVAAKRNLERDRTREKAKNHSRYY